MPKLFQNIAQRQTQNLKLKPKMLQSLNMLAMPILDLDLYLKNELIENPLLEIEDPDNNVEDPPATEEKEEVIELDAESDSAEIRETIQEAQELSEALDHWDDMNYTGIEHIQSKETDFEPQQLLRSSTQKIDEFIEKFYDNKLTEDEQDFGYDLIDSIDSYGFLNSEFDIYDLAHEYNIDNKNADRIHEIIMNIPPMGITARNLPECLLHQLTEKQDKRPKLVRLLSEFFDELVHRKNKFLMSTLKISEVELIEYKNMIGKLDPKPGLRILQNDADYVVPDLVVKRFENEYVVLLNDKFVPKIVLGNRYKSYLRNIKEDKKATSFVRDKINSAKFLVKSMYMRGRTLKRVMYSIIKHQKKFFYEDEQIMVPLVYAIIAEELQVNESTISRVVKDKWVDTPFGLMKMKSFFTSTAGKDKNFKPVSKQQVKLIIRELVNKEDKRQPLSDHQIVGILKQRSIKVSRRVIAKYREALGILNSRLRRKYE